MTEFQEITYDTWLAQLKKELKTDDLSVKHVQYGDMSVDPFFERPSETTTGIRVEKQWSICEVFDLRKHENIDLLKALEGGANYLHLTHAELLEQPKALLQDIVLSFVQVHFNCSEGKSLSTDVLDYIDNLSADDQAHVRFYDSKNTDHPCYRRRLTLSTQVDVVTSLSEIFNNIVNLLDAENDESKRSKIGQSLDLERILSSNIVFEISTIGAIKMIWKEIENGFGHHIPMPQLIATCDSSLDNDELEQKYIAQSFLGLTAAIGGYDVINIVPASEEQEIFQRRISRNVHHLLMMESFTHKAHEGYLGSFQVQSIASKIAQDVWKNIGRD